MNVAVARGELNTPIALHQLADGSPVASFDLRITTESRSETVPVSWPDAPAKALDLEPGDELVVMGRIRRRFFRSGGVTQSRTELVADAVVPARQRKRVERLYAQASATFPLTA